MSDNNIIENLEKVLASIDLDDRKDVFKKIDERHKIILKEYGLPCLMDHYKEEDAKKLLTGKGVASIRGCLNGLKMDSNKYKEEFSKNYGEIIEKIKIIEKDLNIAHSINHYAQKYEEVCKLFPKQKANLIVNRFMMSIFYDSVTTIASFEKLCAVLKYLGKDDLDNDSKNWFAYNIYLRRLLKEAAKNYAWCDNASLGWELVEHIQTIKENDILFENSKNVILTGAPGTGKTHLADKLAKRLTGNDEKRIKMVQFHPSYDYSDFVEGLRPVKDKTGNIGFERKDGVFKAFCKKALKAYNEYNNEEDKEKKNAPKYVFIIDEINRGEMSKIFGELFFSIDPGYRGTKGRIQTQYANMQTIPNEFDNALGYTESSDFGHFFVPSNVYIIGTMNDIDRSVESMDFAMRRRFAFVEITAEDRQCMLDDLECAEELKICMNNVNIAIDSIPGLNSEYHIGPAYFKKIQNYLNLRTPKQRFEALWNNHINGVVYEYLRGNPDADKHLEDIKKAYDKDVED